MEYCFVCQKKAMPGVTASIRGKTGSVCFECAADSMDIPIKYEHFKFSCGSCARRIRTIPFFMANRFFHEDCLKSALQRESEFNYNPHKLKGAIEQASKDAFSVLTAGGIDQLCSICLRFNTSTSLGLPFHGVEPQPISHVCSNCKTGICESHTAYFDKKNILDIDPNIPVCTGAFVSNCYSEIEKKVACAAEECETKSYRFDNERTGWDPLLNSLKCEKCSSYYCNYEHEECPVCVGTACEGCEELIQPDDMLHLQEGMTVHNICYDCYSGMTCLSCHEIIGEPGDQESGIMGYCESCAEKELDYFDCEDCSITTPPQDKVEVVYHADEPDKTKDLCKECAADTNYFQNCPRCNILIDKDGILYYNVEGQAIKACPVCAPSLYGPYPDDPNQLRFWSK